MLLSFCVFISLVTVGTEGGAWYARSGAWYARSAEGVYSRNSRTVSTVSVSAMNRIEVWIQMFLLIIDLQGQKYHSLLLLLLMLKILLVVRYVQL